MIRRALLLFALFLATPALVGAVDAWAFVMIGRTLLVEWDGGPIDACLHRRGVIGYTVTLMVQMGAWALRSHAAAGRRVAPSHHHPTMRSTAF